LVHVQVREADVFVIPILRKILAKYKTTFPAGEDGWVFRGEKLLRPLDLDNLSRREIPQYINGAGSVGTHSAAASAPD
jgi:hypothetical protein